MRVFSAALVSETNTFTNIPTGWRAFRTQGISRGNASGGDNELAPVARSFETLCAAHGFEYVEGLYASAEPAGPVVREVYEAFVGEILTQIAARGPFDMVLLLLHGAMVADGCDDCEGDILARVKAVAPNAVVGAVLDPHCHLTDKMVRNADVLVACKYFPHDDFAERAADLFRVCARVARHEVRAVPGVFDCAMIGSFPTIAEPMTDIVRRFFEAEREPGILSASFIHGFCYGDTPDTGAKVIVYADGHRERAAECASTLGRMIYDLRDRLATRLPALDTALEQAASTAGLVVLADTADNAGAGAPGDNVTVLGELLRRRIDKAALGSIWDPQVALQCEEAGINARLSLRLGGKTNESSGMPLDVVARIRAISADHFQTGLGDTRQPMGLSVWLEIGGVDVVVCSIRCQVFAPDIFTGLGIDLLNKRIVVVKSIAHFYARFAPIAQHVIRMTSPGAASMDFATIPYKNRSLNYYPRVIDPLDVGNPRID